MAIVRGGWNAGAGWGADEEEGGGMAVNYSRKIRNWDWSLLAHVESDLHS
jgi:hypothetical protein